jgi:hypothetical protein
MIARTLLILTALVTISGCSLLGSKQVEIVTKPVQIEIIQPGMPRPIDLQDPKWYVVSEAVIANPCRKVDDKRPRTCAQEDKENPEWPQGYTYLDRFLDDMKDINGGDVVFVATTIKDYELMSANVQELRRYIRELGEVIIYYRDVTLPDGQKGEGVAIEKKENE